jgi:hypothetical protein
VKTSSLSSPNRTGNLWEGLSTSNISDDAIAGVACVLLFLLVNPFLALFILAATSVFHRVPAIPFIISASISFAAFFYFRKYGIDFSPTSDDDIPRYLFFYSDNASLPFLDIFSRFVESPGNNEPLWHVLWWPLLNVFNGSDNTFVFAHYLAIFLALFVSFATLSRRFFVLLPFCYFFLTPSSIITVTHIWRQQLAFSIFLTGIGLYVVSRKNMGKWLIYISPLMHLSAVFFVAVFLIHEFYKKHWGSHGKRTFAILLVLVCAALPGVSLIVFDLLDSIGLERILSYLEGSGDDRLYVFVSVSVYAVLLLIVHLTLKNDDANNIFILFSFAAFSIMFAFPQSNAIYDRLLLFVSPLMGFYFFRCFMINFPARWHLPLILVIFFTGTIRMFSLALNHLGAMQFLAFGRAFDPSMGILKMVIDFG